MAERELVDQLDRNSNGKRRAEVRIWPMTDTRQWWHRLELAAEVMKSRSRRPRVFQRLADYAASFGTSRPGRGESRYIRRGLITQPDRGGGGGGGGVPC